MKLEYKAQAAGRHLIKLDQWFASSKLCSDCGHKMPEMPLHQRQWACPACGSEHDRDINAAMNIQQQGILALKAAGSSHLRQKQKVKPELANHIVLA
ncbi:zinc ribbon domain-containing protein [Aeromonas fluvialis]|uniref:zinc ribbon domain-containing protein n=1 Tax=Aeromonas fluvialis TaxID=591962 RepID=UPI00069360BA|nr:zinc ribbon domain-containing protein [Aeromonas fluvialis]